ncbi:MAG: YgeY family selenium metabolism-linked hydrolase [Anaerolineaceae bacterium]|nr:YgeY family selenium metabolism-linked hydrolase [Anaerolineaceae bacterium]
MAYTKLEEETIQFLSQLVQFVSLSGEEQLVAGAVEAKMKTLDYDEVRRDDYGNVIGYRRGGLPGAAILYDSHMDTVMVANPEEWSHAPWGGEIIDGKIWGRGASDTKGSLAAMVMALGSLPREELAGDVYVVGTVGEEIIEGASLAHVLNSTKVDGVIIGEPTDCRLAIGQKGRARMDFIAHGRAAHTANPEEGENPIDKAVEMLRRVRATPQKQDPIFGAGVIEPLLVSSKPTPSTSTVPFECTFSYDRRLLLGETSESLLAECRSLFSDLKGWQIEMHEASFQTYTGLELSVPDFHPAWLMNESVPFVQVALQAVEAAGIDPRTYVVPYCTNGSASAGELGLPTIIFGPSTIRMAHAVDEHIEIEELLRGLRSFISLGREMGKLPMP